MTRIYILTNMVNGKQYVGFSKDPFYRFNKHSKNDSVVGQAIRKYGKENFSIGILNEVFESKKDAGFREIELIQQLNSRVPPLGKGYNVTAGGDGITESIGFKHTNETKAILSEKNRIAALKRVEEGTNWCSKPKTDEWKRAQGERVRQSWKALSEEQRIIRCKNTSIKSIEQFSDPAMRKKCSDVQKLRWINTTNEERLKFSASVSKASKKRFEDPEERKKRSELTKKQWAEGKFGSRKKRVL